MLTLFEIINPEQPQPMPKARLGSHYRQGLCPSSLQHPRMGVRGQGPRLGIPQKIQPSWKTAVIAFSLEDNRAFPEEAGSWVSRPGCGVSRRFKTFPSAWEETQPLPWVLFPGHELDPSTPAWERGGLIEWKLVSLPAPARVSQHPSPCWSRALLRLIALSFQIPREP